MLTSIGHKIIGDGIVYDKVWDETAEKVVSSLNSGDEGDIFEEYEKKK